MSEETFNAKRLVENAWNSSKLTPVNELAEKEFRWVHVNNRPEIEAFYLSIIEKIREAARTCGYAIGVHGSMRRDLDLIAVPWVDSCTGKDELARNIHSAACGIEMQKYNWEIKPLGRTATCFPVCFPEWNEPNVGHIDLSVVDAFTSGHAAGLEKGIEAAAKHLEEYGLCMFAHGDDTLRHGAVMLASFSVRIRTLKESQNVS